jgi:hypothetical protein
VTEADLEWMGATWTTPPELAQLFADYDRVMSI